MKLIPERNPGDVSGSQFIQNNLNTKYNIFNDKVVEEALKGNIPDFLRKFVSISISEKNNTITYLVMPEVLSIGSDSDFIRTPISPLAATKIADQYHCVLPTKKMCDQIWKAATIKITPQPKGPPYDHSMLSPATFMMHNEKIEKQLLGKNRLELVSGHKKDVIIDKQLLSRKDRVAIYGWFYPNGMAIQGPVPNCSSHEVTFYDYSHGIRFIARDVMVNGEPKDFYEVLKDSTLAYLISEQGEYDAVSIYR